MVVCQSAMENAAGVHARDSDHLVVSVAGYGTSKPSMKPEDGSCVVLIFEGSNALVFADRLQHPQCQRRQVRPQDPPMVPHASSRSAHQIQVGLSVVFLELMSSGFAAVGICSSCRP